MANVVEVVLQAKDQASGAIYAASKSISGLDKQSSATGLSLGKLAVGITAVLGAFKSLGGIVNAIEEAQAAAAQLDAAYAATGATLGRTRQQLDDLATSIQQTTTYNDELVKTAESFLLTFDKVRGDAFDRTIKAAADLGARLGTDLPTAVRSLGRALQEPEQGLAALRRAGVTFSDEQTRIIKALADTGREAEAQNMILSELERRFGGAAEAARNTLGGALTGLKNAFGDLFEGTTRGTSSSVEAVNGLTRALENPKLKTAIDSLIAGLATIAGKVIEVATGIVGLFSKGIETERQKLEREIKEFEKLLAPTRNRAGIQQTSPDDIVMGGGARGIKRSQLEVVVADLKKKLDDLNNPLTEVEVTARGASKAVIELNDGLQYYNVTAKKITDDNPWVQFYEDMQDIRNQSDQDFQEALNQVPEYAQKAFEETAKQVEKTKTSTTSQFEAMSKIIEGVWQGVGQSIQSSLSDMLYNASFSLRSLTDIFRRALADISAAIITSQIGKLLKDQFDIGSSSGSSSSSGIWGTIISSFIGAYAAGGGRNDGPTWTGESGPELTIPSGSGMRTYNQRQLAFAGAGGGGATFAPQYNIGIQGAADDSAIYERVVAFVNDKSQRDFQEFSRLMARNGMARLR